MEPDAFKLGKSIADQVPDELRGDTVSSVAVVSIAISLKRIADAIESNQFTDSVCRAISEGIWSASQKG